MHCKKCGERLEQGDKFCKNCGQSQVAIMASEEGNNNNLLRSENRNNDIGDDIGNKNELISSDDSRAVTFKKKSFFKKIFKGVGIGGLVVSGGFLYILFYIL